jgi:hypothetical protein
MVLHPHVALGKNNYGYTLLASNPIGEGEIVWQETKEEGKKLLSIAKADIWKFEPKVQERLMRFGVETSLTKIVLSSWLQEYVMGKINYFPWENEPDLSDFMNHSCDPNVWYVDDNTLVARRPIEAGEEICEDYGTDRAGNLEFKCLCGSPICRQIIRKTDFELPQLRKRYGNHFRSLILKAFDDPAFAQKLKESLTPSL